MNGETKRHFKDALFAEFARLGKALASPRRLELIDVLAQGERTVEELASETDMTVANASQHLQVLRRARLVETRQEGTYIYYRLADEQVFLLWQRLRQLGETRLTEIEHLTRDYLNQREALEPVRMDVLVERLREGDVVVLDVRPRLEYEAGHIAGARSVPLDELETRLAELPPDAEIVAYCRGPYCIFADEAVERLRHHGRSARRLDLGFPDWHAAGLPVESEVY